MITGRRQSPAGISTVKLEPSASRSGIFPRRWRFDFWRTALTSGLLGLGAAAMSAADIASRTLLLDAARAGDAVIAVGERGTILRSTDNAKSWTAATARVAATLTAVAFGDTQRGWAVGHDALILTTVDGGVSWSRQWQGDNLTDSFLDVLALDGNHAIAVGAYGLFALTSDAGKTWTRNAIFDDDYHLNRISRGGDGTLYIAGEHGTLLRSSDFGASWTPIRTPYDGSFYGVFPLVGDTLLAHGLRGRLYRSENDGETWNAIAITDPVLLATCLRLQGGAIVLGGQARALFVSQDQGRTFVRRDVGIGTGIAELIELADGHLLAVGEAGASRIPAARIAPTEPPK